MSALSMTRKRGHVDDDDESLSESESIGRFLFERLGSFGGAMVACDVIRQPCSLPAMERQRGRRLQPPDLHMVNAGDTGLLYSNKYITEYAQRQQNSQDEYNPHTHNGTTTGISASVKPD